MEEGIKALEQSWLVWIVLFPFLGFLFNGLGWIIFRKRYPRWLANWIGCLSVFGAFLITAFGFYWILHQPKDVYFYQKVFTWLKVGDFQADFGLIFDHLSAIMCLAVTLVGLLIHIYATGYMSHDPAYARFFAYMNLFMFMMLTLVVADNIVLLFVGWEGVGLCSYLLIGFWYEDWEKARAGLKAFIVNRIGDFGFLLGIFTLFWALHTVEFMPMRHWIEAHPEEFSQLSLFGISVATLAGIFLFIGATGKSAQIPLYVWLPDAMAGPTPVSALIHAATMVTAGVYMIGRLSFVYVHSPVALAVVAIVGALTALYAGTIGITQNDIKKVLAYSTISQLGYMFLAMGTMAFSAGIFHLFTHAFFKALLFLAAGSVIVAFHHKEQDITKMGGLSRYLPWTHRTVFIAFLAIIGLPPFAGFFSKDEILWRSLATSNEFLARYHLNKLVWALGVLAALVTAIYMTRWMVLIFWNGCRVETEKREELRESPTNMIIPMILLAVGSAFAGFLGVPHFLGGHNWFEAFLEPAFAHTPPQAVPRLPGIGGPEPVEVILMVISVGMAVLGWLLVHYLYLAKPGSAEKLAEKLAPLYKLSYNKYYVDEIYDYTVVKPVVKGSYYLLFRFFDVVIVDGFVNGVAKLNELFGKILRRFQSGTIHTYLLIFSLGILVVLIYFLWPQILVLLAYTGLIK